MLLGMIDTGGLGGSCGFCCETTGLVALRAAGCFAAKSSSSGLTQTWFRPRLRELNAMMTSLQKVQSPDVFSPSFQRHWHHVVALCDAIRLDDLFSYYCYVFFRQPQPTPTPQLLTNAARTTLYTTGEYIHLFRGLLAVDDLWILHTPCTNPVVQHVVLHTCVHMSSKATTVHDL
jgi:hypothetical protein